MLNKHTDYNSIVEWYITGFSALFSATIRDDWR